MRFYNDRKLNLKADDYIETTYLMHPVSDFHPERGGGCE